MSLFVLSLVLFSALMHAGWNLFVKQSPDRLVTMATLDLVSGVIGIVALPFLPIPHPESWPYLFASVILHLGYQLFLVKAYIYGDLGQVYPIARGTSPLLLGFVSVFWLGEGLSTKMMFAIGLITLGIFSLMFRGKIFFRPFSTSCFLRVGHRKFHCRLYTYRWIRSSFFRKRCFIRTLVDGIGMLAFAGNYALPA